MVHNSIPLWGCLPIIVVIKSEQWLWNFRSNVVLLVVKTLSVAFFLVTENGMNLVNANVILDSRLQHTLPIQIILVNISGMNILNDLTQHTLAGLILGLRPANERRRYFVTTSLIGWAQA